MTCEDSHKRAESELSDYLKQNSHYDERGQWYEQISKGISLNGNLQILVYSLVKEQPINISMM